MLHVGRTFPAQKESAFGRSSILHELLWRAVNAAAMKAELVSSLKFSKIKPGHRE